MHPVRIATRGSRQASTQATAIALSLNEAGVDTELVLVDTYGDQTQSAEVPLHSIGGQGVFVKAVQQAVLDGDADIAVHSAKDLPTEPVEGLRIGAFGERRSPVDTLVGRSIDQLERGAVVATGSIRRRRQLAQVRPDLRFNELRGNIDTRLGKVPDGGAIVVAKAALELLDLTGWIAEELDPFEFVPAVGQGCVVVECRADDSRTVDLVAVLDHQPTRRAVELERAFLAELGSGCTAPVAAYATDVELVTYLADEVTTAVVTHRVELSRIHDDDLQLAGSLAQRSQTALHGGGRSL